MKTRIDVPTLPPWYSSNICHMTCGGSQYHYNDSGTSSLTPHRTYTATVYSLHKAQFGKEVWTSPGESGLMGSTPTILPSGYRTWDHTSDTTEQLPTHLAIRAEGKYRRHGTFVILKPTTPTCSHRYQEHRWCKRSPGLVEQFLHASRALSQIQGTQHTRKEGSASTLRHTWANQEECCME